MNRLKKICNKRKVSSYERDKGRLAGARNKRKVRSYERDKGRLAGARSGKLPKFPEKTGCQNFKKWFKQKMCRILFSVF